jgi:hypothetical protein
MPFNPNGDSGFLDTQECSILTRHAGTIRLSFGYVSRW